MSRSTLLIAAMGLVLVAFVALFLFWDAIPGTFYRDASGFPHGTGRHTYHYRAGNIQLVEEYFRGKLARSEWFKPDGSVVWKTEWHNEDGVGVYLREDGSIRRRMTYVHGLAHGPCTYYGADGRIMCESVYEDSGERVVSGEKPQRGGKDF
jgi:antitoxin component YwqK of YwqJK toxin-antitoxin module